MLLRAMKRIDVNMEKYDVNVSTATDPRYASIKSGGEIVAIVGVYQFANMGGTDTHVRNVEVHRFVFIKSGGANCS